MVLKMTHCSRLVPILGLQWFVPGSSGREGCRYHGSKAFPKILEPVLKMEPIESMSLSSVAAIFLAASDSIWDPQNSIKAIAPSLMPPWAWPRKPSHWQTV